MANNNVPSSSGGIGVFGLTFVVLLALKLLGKITLSWWWVFAPIYLPIIFTCAILLFVFVIIYIKGLLE